MNSLRASEGGIIENNKDTSLPVQFAFIQIINIVCQDGKGFVTSLAFISMKRNGWVLLSRVKKWYQGHVANATVQISQQGAVSSASEMVTGLLYCCTADHRLAVMKRCYKPGGAMENTLLGSVSGAEFLDYLIRHHYAADRPRLWNWLRNSLIDLIYHVTPITNSRTRRPSCTMHAPSNNLVVANPGSGRRNGKSNVQG